MVNAALKKQAAHERKLKKIAGAIIVHMEKLPVDYIYRPTIEMLVLELIESGVGGSCIRGRSMFELMSNGTFSTIRKALDIAVASCQRLELYVTSGVAAIVWEYPYFPDKSRDKSVDENSFEVFSPSMLRYCSANSYRMIIDC